MSHPYNAAAGCDCMRCTRERARRAAQSAAALDKQLPKQRRTRERVASRAEQHARYIDCGPAAWDDRD